MDLNNHQGTCILPSHIYKGTTTVVDQGLEPNAWWWWQRTSGAESSMQQIWSGSISLATRYGRWSWRLLQTFPGWVWIKGRQMDVALSGTHPYQCYKYHRPLRRLARRPDAHEHHCHHWSSLLVGLHKLCLFAWDFYEEVDKTSFYIILSSYWDSLRFLSIVSFWTGHTWPPWPPSYTQGQTVRSRCQEASNISNMDSRKKSALTKLTSTSRCRKAIAWTKISAYHRDPQIQCSPSHPHARTVNPSLVGYQL